MYECEQAQTPEDLEDAILDYADYCQYILELNTWPGQTLCSEMTNDAAFYSVFGDYCDPQCFFGTKNGGTQCVCKKGYWNVTCDSECPGGASNPCSGYGTCNQTGSCDCPLNRQGAEDCSICTDGWIGPDCAIAENNRFGNKSVAMANPLGHMTNLDGLSFIIREQSVYSLLTVSDSIAIQGKFVVCYQNYTCITFLSVRLGDASEGYVTITVMAPKLKTSKPVIYIGNQETAVDEPIYFKGFNLARLDIDKLRITVGDQSEIHITLQSQYLVMEVVLDNQYVSTTSGILSGSGSTNSTLKIESLLYKEIYSPNVCLYTGSTQTPQSTPQSYTLPISSISLAKNMSLLYSLEWARFTILACDEFIYFPSVHYKNQNVGGYSLNFASSVVYGDADLYTTVGPNITFEFLTKIANSSDDEGVLFSFSNTKLFLVKVSYGTIFIEYDNQTYATNLTLQEGKWNKVVVMYYGGIGDFDIYVFNNEGYIERRSYTMPINIFNSPGTLSIGHWKPPYSSKVLSAPLPYSGYIDNFLIWKMSLEPNIVTDIFQIDPLDIQHLLNSLWQFDEGQGSIASDSLQEMTINLPSAPWVPPAWIPSDVFYVKNSYPEVAFVYFDSSSVKTKAETVCNQILDDTFSSCSGMQTSTKQIFYVACLQVYSTTKESANAYSVILSYGRMCQLSFDLAASPVTTLCGSLSNSEIENSGCTKTCNFGEQLDDGSCSCASGYFGLTCSSICPGGSDSPCNNHGKCTDTGLCSCQWNWNGGSDCGTCTSGMLGPDCRVLYLGSTLGNKAYITGKADYMGFNGYQISMDEISGVFTVFDSPSNFAVEVYQVSCFYGSCVIGVSIKTPSTQLVIMPSGQNDMPPIIYKDMAKFEYETTETLSDLTIVMKSFTELEISVGSSSINLLVQINGIDMSIETSPSVCTSSTGIIGNCGGTSETYVSYNQKQLMQFIKDAYLSVDGPIVQTLLDVFGHNVSQNSGFALSFNETSTLTDTLKYKLNHMINSNSFSLSLYFKPESYGGVLLAYSKNTTFSILNSNPIQMRCGTKTIRTDATPLLNEWNQIVTTFDGINNKIHFYHYGPNVTVRYQIINDFCSDLFVEGGKISLGEWIPSIDSEKYSYMDTFVGTIEEASIWKDPIPASLVFQAESLNVKLSGFLKNVTSLWSFSEGVGYAAFDNIMGNDMSLPSYPWQSPVWTVSDKTLKVINDEISLEIETIQDATDLCDSFFDAVSVSCNSIPTEGKSWFRNQCILIGSSNTNISDAVSVMVSFTLVCDLTGGSTTSLYTNICGLDTSVPFWISQVCNNCIFGYKGADGTCTCYYGFYGTNCNSVCPNGIISPCNTKGVCDTSGLCQCEGHWSGTTCGSCATGWEGEECVVLSTGQTVNQTTLVAQVSSNGQIISFDGFVIDLTLKNVYNLFSHSNRMISVYGHVSTCYDTLRTHNCLKDVVFDVNGIFFYVRSSKSFQNNKVVIFTNADDITIYSQYATSEIEISIVQTNTIVCTFTGTGLTVKLVYIDNGLIMTMSYSNAEFVNDALYISGLLTSCDTKTSIEMASCNISRTSICDKSFNTIITSSCVRKLNKMAVEIYQRKHVFIDTTVDTKLERQDIIIGPACLFFSGTGMFVSEVELPATNFAIELHVKPTAVNGPMLTYHTSTHQTIIVNYKTGVVIIADEMIFQTYILLTNDVWNQINLVWNKHTYRLEIYVISDFGITTVKEIACPFDIFESGGTLTVGQIGDGITSLFPIGTFNGYIDELRIWTRPHSPSITRTNWRISVSDRTPDLHAAWSLNEGSGSVASDMKDSQHLYVVNYDKPPTWVASDLDLSPGVDLRLPAITNKTPLSTTVDTSRCDDLLGSTNLASQCSGLENILSDLKNQCIMLVKTTGNSDLAEVILLSVSDYCQNSKNLTDSPIKTLCNQLGVVNGYIPWYGSSCSDECVFGTVNNSVCNCDASHYGPSCSGVCGLGPLGSCNKHGTCDSSSGHCRCDSHWNSYLVTVSEYWKSFSLQYSIKISVSTYSCTECSSGWYGADCNFVVQTFESSQSHAVGFTSASYITTLGGASYRMILPGIYKVYSVSGLSVQAVFWPCYGDIFCRIMKEISVSSGGQTVSVLKYNDTLQPMHVSGQTVFVYPTTKYVSNIQVKWIVQGYVRITVGSFSVLVSDSNNGLICRFKIGVSSGTSATGLLGNTDDSWWMDLISPNDKTSVNSSFIDKSLSASYTGLWTKNDYGSSLSSVHTWHTNRQQNLTTAGFLLHLTKQSVTYSSVHVDKDITALTISFWMRLQVHLVHQSLISYWLNGENLTLISNDGRLTVQWGDTWTTSLDLKSNTWIYTALTWKSSDGELLLFLMTDGGLQYNVIKKVHQSTTINIESIYIIGNENSPFEIDHIRIWKVAKTLDMVLGEMSTYVDDVESDQELIALIKCDEGSGLVSMLDTPTSSGKKSVTGIISEPETDDLWMPSDIHTDKSYMPRSLSPSSLNETILDECIAALNNSDVVTYCKDVSNITEFFLEACLADYESIGENATDILIVHNLIFYCQATFSVDECRLKQYFDYCTDENEDTSESNIMLIIIAIVCIIPILVFIICCCCWFHGLLCFKKCRPASKVGKKKDDHKQAFVDPEDEEDADVAYSRSRINSRNSHMIFGDDNEGFRTLDSGMSGRASSALSASDFPILFDTSEDDLISPLPPRNTVFTPVPMSPMPHPSSEGPRSTSSLLATLGSIITKVKKGPKGNHPAPADVQLQDANTDDQSCNVPVATPKTFSRKDNMTPVFGTKTHAPFTRKHAATPVFSKHAPKSDHDRPDSASSETRARSRSPFVTPGFDDSFDSNDETVSPFQPEELSTFSVMNRGFSPDIHDTEPVFNRGHDARLTPLVEVPSMESFRSRADDPGRGSRAANAIHGPGVLGVPSPNPMKQALQTRSDSQQSKAKTGRSSRSSNAIHGSGGMSPNNVEEEVIIRPPSYSAPSPGLLIDLDDMGPSNDTQNKSLPNKPTALKQKEPNKKGKQSDSIHSAPEMAGAPIMALAGRRRKEGQGLLMQTPPDDTLLGKDEDLTEEPRLP